MKPHATMYLLSVIVMLTILGYAALAIAIPVAYAASPAQDTAYYPPGETAYGFVPLEKFEGSAKLSNIYDTSELGPFLNKLFLAAMSLGAVLAVLRLAWAGFQYMASDLWSSKEHAKEIIRETLLGLFILLGIWLILGQINPDILKLNVNITPLPKTTPAAASTPAPSAQEIQENSGNPF